MADTEAQAIIRKAVREVLADVQNRQIPAGPVIAVVMRKLRGRYDPGQIHPIVLEVLKEPAAI